MKKILSIMLIAIFVGLTLFGFLYAKSVDLTSFNRDRRIPVLDLDTSGAGTGYEVTFTENGSAVILADTDVNITATSPAQLKYAVFNITNAKTGDSLDYSGVNSLFTPAVTSGTGIYTLTTTGNASFATYKTMLQNVKYTNSSDNPDTTTREVTIYVSNGNDNSNICTTSVVITAVNDAPALYMGGPATLDYETAYEGGSTEIAVASTECNIVDPDDTYMESLTMLLSNAKTSDVLLTAEVDLLGTFAVVNDTATPGAITVTLTGHATIAEYKAAAQLIKFYNAETSEIDTTNRVIYTVVNDGTVNSANATTTITVTAPQED